MQDNKIVSDKHELFMYDFTVLAGVSKEIDEAIKKNYESLEELSDVNLDDLRKIRGVGSKLSIKILEHTRELLADIKKKREKSETNIVSGPLKVGSDEPTKEDEISEGEERRYVLVEKKIDKFNYKRTRILLTPAVCPKCGFDVIETNKLVPYAELSQGDQRLVRDALKQHINNYHATAEDKILTESQMKDTSWVRPQV